MTTHPSQWEPGEPMHAEPPEPRHPTSFVVLVAIACLAIGMTIPWVFADRQSLADCRAERAADIIMGIDPGEYTC